MKKKIRYALFMADRGGMQIMYSGERYATNEEHHLQRVLGSDITTMIKDMCISDALVTITIEELGSIRQEIVQDNEA